MDWRISWSERAIADVDAIASFIALDSAAYASVVVREILRATEQLVHFPRSGRVVPELARDDIREILVYSYRVIYQIKGTDVIVLGVVHGKRLLPQT